MAKKLHRILAHVLHLHWIQSVAICMLEATRGLRDLLEPVSEHALGLGAHNGGTGFLWNCFIIVPNRQLAPGTQLARDICPASGAPGALPIFWIDLKLVQAAEPFQFGLFEPLAYAFHCRWKAAVFLSQRQRQGERREREEREREGGGGEAFNLPSHNCSTQGPST